MTIECIGTSCIRKVPYSHFIGLEYVDTARAISSDCSKNILYLTDDPGAMDLLASTPDLNPLLDSTSSASYCVSLFDQQGVDSHFQACSRTNQELSWFFRAPVRRGIRPASITVAYRDPSETWVEAYDRVLECKRCFRYVTHVSHDVNDAPFHDLPDQIDLGVYALSNRMVPVFPTRDPVLPTDYTETGTIPGQAGSTDISISWAWMIQKDECEFVCVDEDGIDVRKPWYQPDHLMYAAIHASYGFNDARYDFSGFMQGGQWPGAMAADFSQAELINLTGIDPATGRIPDATRSVNVFVHSEANTRGYIEGNTANFFCTSQIAQRFAIENDMMQIILERIHGQQYPLGLTSDQDLSAITAIARGRIQTYINKRIVDDRLPQRVIDNLDNLPEYKWSERFDPADIVDGGDGYGWVLTRQTISEISDSDLAAGLSPFLGFCFSKGCGLKRPRVNICRVLRPGA